MTIIDFPWWAIALMAVAIFGLGAVFFSLFSHVGERPARAVVVGECKVGSVDFMLALSGVTNAPLHPGGTARLLNNGDEFIPAMLDAIRSARHSINFTTYMWHDGQMSDRFFDAFIEAARSGRQVRILIDAFGGLRAPRHRIEEFRAAGGVWREFHAARFGNLMRIHKRTHRRALIVDGLIGFTGGASIMDKWLGDARNPDEWRDCMVEVRGRLAVSLQSAFAQLWSHKTGELLCGSEFYPRDAHEAEEESDGEPIRRHVNFNGSPSSETHPMRQVFWFSIRCARERVYITNPYFVPDDLLKDALRDQARNGVDVRLLVPNRYNDLPIIRFASQSHYEDMLEAGVRIFEYQPTMIHQKLLVADDVWSLVGSVNMDIRSKELNQENALGMLDRGFATELTQTFLADLERSVEIDRDRWRRRPAYRRVIERFFRLFQEQF